MAISKYKAIAIFISFHLLFTVLQPSVASTRGKSSLPKNIIKHQAESSFSSLTNNIELKANIVDDAGVYKCRCYFRLLPDGEYFFTEMVEGEESNYSCTLPTHGILSGEVEYFFLAVNSRQQVIRSLSYFLQNETTFDTSSDETLFNKEIERPQLALLTESPHEKRMGATVFGNSSPSIQQVSPLEDYGHRIGLTKFPDCKKKVENVYIGGFQFIEPDIVIPIPGSYCAVEGSDAPAKMEDQREIQSYNETNRNQVADDTSTINISGDNWLGNHYRTDFPILFPITADILQELENVTIDTTEVEGFYPAHHFIGTISQTGDMVVEDTNDGQLWSTYYGPITNLSVILADFVSIPDPEDSELPPLFVVDLERVEEVPNISIPGPRYLLLSFVEP